MSQVTAAPPPPSLWSKIQNAFSASSLAAARNVLMALMGVVTTLGLIGATQSQALVDKVMAVGTAIGVLLTAVSALVMVATPIFAGFKESLSQQIKSVSEQPHTVVVQTSTPEAMVKVAEQVATMPEVKQVVASPRVATATVSEKVVAATDARPITEATK